MIYFLQAMTEGGLGPIKIGYSATAKTLRRRMYSLQSGLNEVRLCGTMPGTQSEERTLHARFSNLQIRNEWFRYEEPLKTFVETLEPHDLDLRPPPNQTERVVAAIAQKIQDGSWPPGQRLPVVAEIMEELAVSRGTALSAIHRLVGGGLIVKRGKAWYVERRGLT